MFIHQSELAPGSEWQDATPAWKIVLIRKGFLYWMARAETRELQPGEVLIIGPAVKGILRASQINSASLHYFYFHSEHLVGLMSLAERLALEAYTQTAQTRIIAATDPVAQEFAQIVADQEKRQSFFYRCRVLHLVAMIFGDTWPGLSGTKNHVARTLLRFEEIISRIPDADLIHYSSEKLAEMCGCSLRHFRRMFRQQFQTSIRAKQTELRLEKARQLLTDTDQKITTVATVSGYRHLGLFNSMFKKKFGVTPSEWRRLKVSSEMKYSARIG